MNRRIIKSLLAVTAVAALSLGGVAAADASAAVTIKKISNAHTKSKATIRPKVSAASNARLVSSRITVKKGGRTLAKNATKVKLPIGKYKVTTTVKYRTKSVVTSTVPRTSTVTVPTYQSYDGTCFAANIWQDQSSSDFLPYISATLKCTSPSFDQTVSVDFTKFWNDGYWWGIDDDPDTATFATSAATILSGASFSAKIGPSHNYPLTKTTNYVDTVNKDVWSGIRTVKKTQTLKVTR